ncbi:MAG TPA: hypothetical protein PLW09_08500, partial [Candidatus Kapabacteria bacterium]|nr:hypothetical protein [Candidatus Kapabacteria bacterium]
QVSLLIKVIMPSYIHHFADAETRSNFGQGKCKPNKINGLFLLRIKRFWVRVPQGAPLKPRNFNSYGVYLFQ